MKNLLIIIVLLFIALSCSKKITRKIYPAKGDKGNNGIDCRVEQASNGLNVICGDSTAFLPNGMDGLNGINGDNGQDGTFQGEIKLVEVCSQVNDVYVESLIYLDGQYLAYMSSNNYMNQRLVLLQSNVTYVTTDSRLVQFMIDDDSNIICL